MLQYSRYDPERARYEAEIREICRLARVATEQADRYIRRRTPRDVVMNDYILGVFCRRLPSDAARHMAKLIGPVGSRRHTLPKNLSRYMPS